MGVQDFAALSLIFLVVWLFVRVEARSNRETQREYTEEARARLLEARYGDRERIEDLMDAVDSLTREIERLKGHG